jgi:hypothetical protein
MNTLRVMQTKILNLKLSLVLIVLFSAKFAGAQNPIVQTKYTADPAPMVWNDRLYLYTTHDEDGSTWFTMNNWNLYSTNDMVNWTDHGVVLSYYDFEWAKGDAWAPQCIERDGKFYMYVPMISKTNNRGAIGVAVADSPMGPFYDPIGAPLVQTDWGDIDPSVFIDDDGQAYMYWGNPNLYYVKLNDNMISYDGEVVKVPLTEGSFGKREGDANRSTLYEEGPWLYKRKDIYYLFWPGGPLPEHIGYSTAKSAEGPWKYGGVVMPTQGSAFTNHPGVIDFRGKTYFFYHNGALPGGGGFNRSVCVEEMTFNADGSIPQLRMTEGIKGGLATLNPYILNQAETIAFSEGFKASQNKEVGVFVTANQDGSYIKVRDVDFKDKGAKKFRARVSTTHNDPVFLEVRLGSVDAESIASVRIPRTGGAKRWAIVAADIPGITGVHDLYFVVKGSPKSHLMYFDYWMFSE